MFSTTYRHDRRKHRHRCWVCCRILNAGEPVIMHRPRGGRGYRAMHEACGESQQFDGLTSRELAALHENPP